MAIVSPQTVRLQAQATDKADAIRQAGELLVQGGCVDPPYIRGMLAREETMSTYLGTGVAIPTASTKIAPIFGAPAFQCCKCRTA